MVKEVTVNLWNHNLWIINYDQLSYDYESFMTWGWRLKWLLFDSGHQIFIYQDFFIIRFQNSRIFAVFGLSSTSSSRTTCITWPMFDPECNQLNVQVLTSVRYLRVFKDGCGLTCWPENAFKPDESAFKKKWCAFVILKVTYTVQ